MTMTRVAGGVLAALLLVFAPATLAENRATAVFAGGCFWCMQPPYDQLEGVVKTEVGFTGGYVDDPTYDQVVAGGTGHLEAVRITYEPAVVSYEKLLDVFWRNVDPLDDGGQFCDRGDHYRTGIFVGDAEQREKAEASRDRLNSSDRFDRAVVTGIYEADRFYLAEEYHQNYYQKRPLRYRYYRASCGRDGRLSELWGD